MKIEILRENLERAISIASKVSNKNLSLPVLGCVVFHVESDRAVVRATNLDVSVEVVIKARIVKQGVVAVPAHILAQTISVIADQRLTLELVGNTLTIQGGQGKTSITVVEPSEFPTLPYVKEGKTGSITLPVHDFTQVLRSVVFAASTSSIKPELASVALSLHSGELTAAATDSFRLAEIRIPTKSKNTIEQILIPARNIPEIVRALENESEVELRVGDNQCSFISSFGYITSRTIDGSFPDYQAVIPKNFISSAICLKEDALRAFKKISIFTDSFNHVYISFKPSDKIFSVRALNTVIGETNDALTAVLEGEDIEINFNTRYIMDALPLIATDSAIFSVAGPGRPMVITDSPHKHFTYLVMPMNK